MQKIGNFDIVINKSLWDINQGLSMPNLSKNDFILSVINGFEDGKWREKEFHRFIFNNIAQTGLSAEDRDNLYSESPYTTLTESINCFIWNYALPLSCIACCSKDILQTES